MQLHPDLRQALAALFLSEERPPVLADWLHFLERISRRLEGAEARATRPDATQDRSEAVLRALGHGLLVLDGAGRIEYANPEGERILGRARAELREIEAV